MGVEWKSMQKTPIQLGTEEISKIFGTANFLFSLQDFPEIACKEEIKILKGTSEKFLWNIPS